MSQRIKTASTGVMNWFEILHARHTRRAWMKVHLLLYLKKQSTEKLY